MLETLAALAAQWWFRVLLVLVTVGGAIAGLLSDSTRLSILTNAWAVILAVTLGVFIFDPGREVVERRQWLKDHAEFLYRALTEIYTDASFALKFILYPPEEDWQQLLMGPTLAAKKAAEDRVAHRLMEFRSSRGPIDPRIIEERRQHWAKYVAELRKAVEDSRYVLERIPKLQPLASQYLWLCTQFAETDPGEHARLSLPDDPDTAMRRFMTNICQHALDICRVCSNTLAQAGKLSLR